MLETPLHKDKVGGYAYNDAITLLTHIGQVLEHQLYEDSADGIKGLASYIIIALNKYKSTIHIKKRDVLAASIAATNSAITDNITVELDITNNIYAQEKSDRQNVFHLAAIGVKEGIVQGITRIVGRDITKPILRTTDNSNINWWINIISINSSTPSQSGQRDLSPQTSGGSSSTFWGQFSIGERHP